MRKFGREKKLHVRWELEVAAKHEVVLQSALVWIWQASNAAKLCQSRASPLDGGDRST